MTGDDDWMAEFFNVLDAGDSDARVSSNGETVYIEAIVPYTALAAFFNRITDSARPVDGVFLTRDEAAIALALARNYLGRSVPRLYGFSEQALALADSLEQEADR